MEQQTHTITEDSDTREILASLKASLQEHIGKEMRVFHLLELTPILTEVALEDPASGSLYFARCYRVPKEQHGAVQDLWAKHSAGLQSAFKLLPQKAQGLKVIGNILAYVAADVPGIDLETYLSYSGPVRPEMAVRISVNLIRALEKLAELKCHHYQIHPGNVMITPEGKPVLKWAGLANFEYALAEFLGVDNLIDATYAAPEQLNGTGFLPSTDIYQMGLLMYRMVAGAPPFQGSFETVKDGHLNQPLPNPQAVNKTVTSGCIRVLIKALAKDPHQRFPNLTEFKTALAFLQPALERAETTGMTDAKAVTLKEKDKAQVEQLLQEAETFLTAQDFKSALRTLDSVFVLAGYHGEAARLHQQTWEALYGTTARKYTAEAVKQWDQGKAAKAFPALTVALSVMPRFKPALKLQSDIFSALVDRTPVLPTAIDPRAFLGKAVELKAKNPMLAEVLWTQVLLIPTPIDQKAKTDLQFQRQLAVRGLRGIGNEPAPTSASINLNQPDNDRTLLAAPLPDLENYRPEADEHDDFDDIFGEPKAQAAPPLAAPPLVSLPPLPTPKPMAIPTSSANSGSGSFERPAIPKTAPPPVQPKAQQPPPPSAPSKSTSMLDEDEEDLLGLPPKQAALNTPVSPAASKPGPSKPKSKALIYGALAAGILIVAVLAALLVMRQVASSKKAAATAAYQAAESLENQGQWEEAQKGWDTFVAEYPNQGGEKRMEELRMRIQTQKYEIQNRIESAKTRLASGLIYEPDENGKSALDMLREILVMEPEEPTAKDLIAKIRSLELERVEGLYTSGQVPEAYKVYTELQKVGAGFKDEALEAKLKQWLTESVLGPGLNSLDNEIAKGNWERAHEQSDQLKAKVDDPKPVNDRWDAAFQAYSAKRDAAKVANNMANELAALEAMSEIRPDDTSLISERDRLSNLLNHEKIVALEAQLAAARNKNDRSKAINLAFQLRKLDSTNANAKSALNEVRSELDSKIDDAKKTNPRAALPLYQELLKVAARKPTQKAINELQSRISAFDAATRKLKGEGKVDYQTRTASIDGCLAQYKDFSEDSSYKELASLAKELASEAATYQELVKYEQNAAGNQTISYQTIAETLAKKNSLKFPYGKEKINAMIDTYHNKATSYEGTVTVVIRTGLNLPSKKKKASYVCELKAGDKVFKSQVIKGPNPKFDEICTFQAKAATNLTFTVYEQIRKDQEKIGSISLSSIPGTEKGKTLKGEGGWSLIVDIRRER